MRKYKNKTIFAAIFLLVFLAGLAFYAWPQNSSLVSENSHEKINAKNFTQPPQSQQYPTDTADSLWAVVNKGRTLPSNYVPANLVTPKVALRLISGSGEMQVRSDTAYALEQMFTEARNQGLSLMLASGYRSYATQASLYQNYVNTQGQSAADTFSARPGHSEHQTGLAADVEPASRECELDQCFETTPEGIWLAVNSYHFGFIIRYTKDSQNLTGYEYEPWHIRYVGLDLAKQLHASGQTLEQYFQLPPFANYPANSLALKEGAQ